MRFFNWFRGRTQRSGYLAPIPARTYNGWADDLKGTPTNTGVVVNTDTALGVSAVWCAVKVISESIGSLPLVLYRQGEDGGRDRAEDHPLAELLDCEPNTEVTARVFWEAFLFQCLLHGNGFAEVQRDGSGKPVALWLVPTQYVQVLRDTESGQLVYRVTLPAYSSGQPGTANAVVTLSRDDMLHVPGLCADGNGTGFNLLRLARQNIGYSIALDTFGQAYFGNSAKIGGTLTHPGQLSDQARANLKTSWQTSYQGVAKTGNVALLEEGLKFEPFTLSNEAAQYDEARRFQITEVSRLFNISPTKLHELGRATWGNLSALNTDFWGTTCRPWAEKIEAELERKLLSPAERKTLYIEFDADTLTRGDVTTRLANYAVGIACGVYTVDECREWENLPPAPEPDPVPAPVVNMVAPQDQPATEDDTADPKGEEVAE